MSDLIHADLIARIKALEAQVSEISDREMELWSRNRDLQNKLDMITTERSPMPNIQDEPQYEYE